MAVTLNYQTLFERLTDGYKLTADGGKSYVEFNTSYQNPFRHIINKEQNVPMDENWSETQWEYYDDNDTKLIFKEWLEKEGALEGFLKQGKPDRAKDTSPGLWLGYSNSKIFSWLDTEEGFSYWEKVNNKWQEVIKHYSNVESGF